ncbi:MAG: nuclear transport factor 2 family protein [Saprospiraceae bacterium]|nr:nuclear transport factor 2 family protein [Saprospiraceae bacterium]
MRLNLVCLLLLSFHATLLAQPKKGEQYILDTELRRFEAMTRKDTALLRPMLADELIYMHSNALTERKSEHLEAIASGRIVYEKMTREQARVRRYGKTAIVNGVAQVRGMLNQNSFELRLGYTAVYRKKRGAWRLVNWQSTRIP